MPLPHHQRGRLNGIARSHGAGNHTPAGGEESKLPGAAEAPQSGRPTTHGNNEIVLKRAGIELRLVVPGSTPASPPDETFVRIIAKAHQIRDRLFAEPELTVPMLAEREGVTPSYVTRLLRLAFLALDIVMAMLEGQQPLELTANKLLVDMRLPIAWAEQRQALGFE